MCSAGPAALRVTVRLLLALTSVHSAGATDTRILLSEPAARVGGDHVYQWGDTIELRFDFAGKAEDFQASCSLEGCRMWVPTPDPLQDHTTFTIPLLYSPDDRGQSDIRFAEQDGDGLLRGEALIRAILQDDNGETKESVDVARAVFWVEHPARPVPGTLRVQGGRDHFQGDRITLDVTPCTGGIFKVSGSGEAAGDLARQMQLYVTGPLADFSPRGRSCRWRGGRPCARRNSRRTSCTRSTWVRWASATSRSSSSTPSPASSSTTSDRRSRAEPWNTRAGAGGLPEIASLPANPRNRSARQFTMAGRGTRQTTGGAMVMSQRITRRTSVLGVATAILASCSGSGGGGTGSASSPGSPVVLTSTQWATGLSATLQLSGGAAGEYCAFFLDLQTDSTKLPGGASLGLAMSPAFTQLGTSSLDGAGNAMFASSPVDSSVAGVTLYLQAVTVPNASGPVVDFADPDLRTSDVVAVTVVDSNPGGGGSSTPANEWSPVGMNLAPATFWSRQLAFVDVFRTSNLFQASSGTLTLRSDGYPASLLSGQSARTSMCKDIDGLYPAGRYTCLYDGTGSLSFVGDATEISSYPGRITLSVTPSSAGIVLMITDTDVTDPVRNIRVVMPGFKKTYKTNPFHPTFLDLVDEYRVLRFMDWNATNNSTVQEWVDRTTTSFQTQGGVGGVAPEYMIQLANTTLADPWLCIPHLASDDYVTQLATLVRDTLVPSLKVYIEYSNEVWNGSFQQNSYAQNMGLTLGLDTKPLPAQLKFYAQRSVEIFQIWEQVFGDTSRLVRVLAAQSVSPYTSQTIMDWQNAYLDADALAIAPYVGGPLGRSPNAEVTVTWNVDQVLDACDAELAQIQATLTTQAADAAQRGLRLIAYEGGQHLVGTGSWKQDPTLNALFDQANVHPRMQTLYENYLQMWRDVGGEMFVLYSDMTDMGSYGRWGLLEWYDQDPATSPKYQGTFNFVYQNPRWW